MNKTRLPIATAIAMSLAACGSGDKLQSTNAGPENLIQSTDSSATLTTTETAPPVENPTADTAPADTTQTDGKETVEQEARYDTDLDALEQAIKRITETAPLLKDGDPQAAVRMANVLNHAKTKLGDLKAKADNMTAEQRDRLAGLASELTEVTTR